MIIINGEEIEVIDVPLECRIISIIVDYEAGKITANDALNDICRYTLKRNICIKKEKNKNDK